MASRSPQYVKISAASSGDNALVAAVTGNSILVLGYTFISSGTVSVKFVDTTAAVDLTGAMPVVAGGGASPAVATPNGTDVAGQFMTSSGGALGINLSGATGVYGHLTYILIPR